MSSNFNIKTSLLLGWSLAKRDLKNRYAGSYAGMAWNIGVPLLYSIINVVVFSVLMTGRMGERYGDIPFSLFYFVPFSLWILFSETVVRSTGILREYSYLINKIAFPSWILPLIPLASALLSQAIILALTACLMLYFNVSLAGSAYMYIFIWLIALMFTIGVAYAISALAVYVPDLSQAVPVCVTILFWLTPILYPATLVENHGAFWIRNIIMNYNPFYYLVEFSRHAIFGTSLVSWATLGIMGATSILVLIIGALIFKKLQPGFADVI
jgi:lipopolysaccharide transport system permease protein